MRGRAAVFINMVQAARFGHVGWGFALDEASDRYYFGSTDHLYRHQWWDVAGWLRYSKVPPSGHVDWWSGVGTLDEMLLRMHRGSADRYHIRYHAAKLIAVESAQPQEAQAAAEFLEVNGWAVMTNNCVHQAFDVLTAYGAQLPDPRRSALSVMPKRWFSDLPGETIWFDESARR